MVAKFNSKTHFAISTAITSKFVKVQILYDKKILFNKNKKNAEFDADFESVGKVAA
jgi:hypothetical protein